MNADERRLTYKKRKLKLRLLENKKIVPHLFLLPFIILLIVFSLFPVGFSSFLSLQKWRGMGSMQFTGLKNFIFVITRDSWFWNSIQVTLWFLLLGSITQHFIAIPLAITLNNKIIKGRGLFKTAYFLPFITSSVSISIIFRYVFSDHSGLMNFILQSIGAESQLWYTDKRFVPVAIATIINWRYIGWNTVIYLAGLQSIPLELYEAADMDGASGFRKHFFITLPLMLPIIFFALSLSIIYGMQLFDVPFIFTGGFENTGGPGNVGFTTAFYIMWCLIRGAKLGRGSAISWVLFMFVLFMTLVNRKITNYLQGEKK